MNDINRKRIINEVDNLKLFLFHIQEIIGKDEAAVFAAFPEIVKIKDLNPLIQKTTINFKIRNMLMIYSNRTGNDASQILSYILDDAEDYMWLDLLDRSILLYFKKNEVFKHLK